MWAVRRRLLICLFFAGNLQAHPEIRFPDLEYQCEVKTGWAIQTIQQRDQFTVNERLQQVKELWDNELNQVFPLYASYVDLERIVREVYRKRTDDTYRVKSDEDSSLSYAYLQQIRCLDVGF